MQRELKSEWISVKDRLPERLPEGFKTYIIASWSHEREFFSVTVADWRESYFQDRFGEKVLMDDGYWEIKYWMPLPSPPELPEKQP
jgi:hypothetical protein